jgi:hypothetical protein
MYGRDEREDIGNQGEENIKAILAHHFGKDSVQNTEGYGGSPDIYIVSSLGRMAVEAKTMAPFSVDNDRKKKKVRRIGYTHVNKASWRMMNEFARGRIANVCVLIEVRFRHHLPIYFLLKREDVEEWVAKVSEKAVWANIPLWYIHERGIGFSMDIPPEFDWTPLETDQVQMESVGNE